MAARAERPAASASFARLSERTTLWLLIAILAWVQFPLGSNHRGRGVSSFFWSRWIGSPGSPPGLRTGRRRCAWRSAWPFRERCCFRCCLGLGPERGLYAGGLAQSGLEHGQPRTWTPVAGAISINPFVSATELMKLASYVAIGWLAFVLAARYKMRARSSWRCSRRASPMRCTASSSAHWAPAS